MTVYIRSSNMWKTHELYWLSYLKRKLHQFLAHMVLYKITC